MRPMSPRAICGRPFWRWTPATCPRGAILGLALSKMAQAMVATGDLQAGLAAQEEALAFRRDTLNADPTVPIHVVDVYYTLREVALLRRDMGDTPRAVAEMTEVVQMVDTLAQSQLDNLPYLYESANYGWELAGMILATGDAAGAVAPAQASLATAQALVAGAPADQTYLCNCCCRPARWAARSGKCRTMRPPRPAIASCPRPPMRWLWPSLRTWRRRPITRRHNTGWAPCG